MANKLLTILETPNVATLLDEEKLNKISQQAINGYKGDVDSRKDWLERNEEGMKLAMQIKGPARTFPFEDPSDVKFPGIATAAMQFSARALPALVPAGDIVKVKVIGKDPNGEKAGKAQRVGMHMNWQLNEDFPEWQEETDRLITVLPIIGSGFKKTAWSMNRQRIISSYISSEDLVMHYKAKSMEAVPRITEKYNLYPNEVEERFRADMFLPFELPTPVARKDEGENDILYATDDEHSPHLFLQQHTWLDLDEDGYAEPYILNIHKDTEKVVRIVPRFNLSDVYFKDNSKTGKVQKITAKQHYTRFTFMNSPDGAIYGVGFGSLLLPVNEVINTVINQIIDSASLLNSMTGFMSGGVGLGTGKTGGTIDIEIGKMKMVKFSGDELRKNIVMLSEFLKDPSPVLFNLLGFMVSMQKELSSVSELMAGEQSVHNEPLGTSMRRLEESQKVFSAIHKRLHGSSKQEYRKIFDLNSEYLNPNVYFNVLDSPNEQSVAQSDYDKESADVVPVSNPEAISQSAELMKSQALMQLQGQGFNDAEIRSRFLADLHVPEPKKILEAPEPPPDPKIVLQSEKLALERSKFEFDMMKFGYEMAELKSKIIKNLAEAEAKELGAQLDGYIAETDRLVAEVSQTQAQQTPAGGNDAG